MTLKEILAERKRKAEREKQLPPAIPDEQDLSSVFPDMGSETEFGGLF